MKLAVFVSWSVACLFTLLIGFAEKQNFPILAFDLQFSLIRIMLLVSFLINRCLTYDHKIIHLCFTSDF